MRQGKLREVTDSKWLNHAVVNQQGENIGKITKVLKDEKTENIEYVMFQIKDVQSSRPFPWAKFQEKGDKLVLNMTKEELQPVLSQKDAKDMSPDLAMFMDEIEVRPLWVSPHDQDVPGAGDDQEDHDSFREMQWL